MISHLRFICSDCTRCYSAFLLDAVWVLVRGCVDATYYRVRMVALAMSVGSESIARRRAWLWLWTGCQTHGKLVWEEDNWATANLSLALYEDNR